MITPLCGVIFQCGCTWPGLGLETGCNFYNSEIQYRCPWCMSWTMAAGSIGAAWLFGMLISIQWVKENAASKEILVGNMIGLMSFMGMAVICGWISAWLQQYPLTLL